MITIQAKIQLEDSEHQFKQAWTALKQLGFSQAMEHIPAKYLYCHSDGQVTVDASTEDSALDNFNDHPHRELTFDELLNMAIHHKELMQEQQRADLKIMELERPLFEAAYVKKGGKLQYLKWEISKDGEGVYQPDWEAITMDGINDMAFDEGIVEIAETVTSCFCMWIECLKSKILPDGHIAVPITLSHMQAAKIQFILGPIGRVDEKYAAILRVLQQ